MNLRIALMVVGSLLGLGQVADAQLTQIRRDYRQPMTYSPDDPFVKGWVYRLQTGQAGKFFNCDGEEEKRYSPYITWQTVCNRTCPTPYCRVLLRDLNEVKQRVRAGACRGGQDCGCPQCQAGSGGRYAGSGGRYAGSGERYAANHSEGPAESEARLAASEMAPGGFAELADADSSIDPEEGLVKGLSGSQVETQHVVYGSRTTRQRMAEQGSFQAATEQAGEQPVDYQAQQRSGNSRR